MSIANKQMKYIEPAQYSPASCMSKREFYAGLAMQGIIASPTTSPSASFKDVAKDSVRYADELIKELEKTDGHKVN